MKQRYSKHNQTPESNQGSQAPVTSEHTPSFNQYMSKLQYKYWDFISSITREYTGHKDELYAPVSLAVHRISSW